MRSDLDMGFRCVLVKGLLLATLIGCGGSRTGNVQTSDSAKIRAMQSLYQQFITQHNQRPRDEQEFRDFLNKKQDQLQQAGLSVDQVFVSPRGSVPLRWNYGANPAGGQRGTSYFAYEAEPVDGYRLVIAARGSTLMDETQFRQAVPNAP